MKSCGGNILINVGPTKEGIIVPIFEERLKQLGQWLKINGESIYSTKPWKYQNDTTNSNVWYTQSKSNPNIIYAILLKYPSQDLNVKLTSPKTTSFTKIELIGYNNDIQWVQSSDGLVIDLSTVNPVEIKSDWAWVFRLKNID